MGFLKHTGGLRIRVRLQLRAWFKKFLVDTDNVTFGRFAYDSTDGHPKKCQPILNHAAFIRNLSKQEVRYPNSIGAGLAWGGPARRPQFLWICFANVS